MDQVDLPAWMTWTRREMQRFAAVILAVRLVLTAATYLIVDALSGPRMAVMCAGLVTLAGAGLVLWRSGDWLHFICLRGASLWLCREREGICGFCADTPARQWIIRDGSEIGWIWTGVLNGRAVEWRFVGD